MAELTLADRLRRCPSPLKALLIVLAVGAAHGLGSWFIVIFRGEPLYVIWPGVGVGLVALHLFGRSQWPWLLVGGVAVQAVSNGNLGLYTWLFPVVDTMESWIAVTLLAKGGVDVTFPRVRDVGRYAVLAAVVPTLLGASVGLSAAVLSGDAYYREPITWLHWWLADLQGMLHPATVLLTWIYPPPEGARRWRPSTLWPAMAAVVAASAIVGATPAASPFAPALYMLPVAVVLATTVGHGPRGATVTSLLATVTLVTALSGDSGDQTLAINRYAGIEVASLGLLLIALAVAGLLAELAASSRAREAMAAQLAESTRLDALGRVAAGVAHDFNNLLTVILGNASLLRLLTADGRSQQLLHEVETTSQRAAELCRQMLTVGGLSHQQTERLGLPAVIDDMAGILRAAVGKGVTLEFDLAPDMPLVDADATQVRQVLVNLVVNAAEASQAVDAAVVCVRVSEVRLDASAAGGLGTTPPLEAGHYVRLDVADRGEGIERDTAARIFDPFFTTKFTGRGLGLSVVLGIVRAHRAGIVITSRPGEGTVASVLWPAAAPPA